MRFKSHKVKVEGQKTKQLNGAMGGIQLFNYKLSEQMGARQKVVGAKCSGALCPRVAVVCYC